jgi:hypothetical protein
MSPLASYTILNRTFLLLLFLLATPSVRAQTTSARLSGFVYDEAGSPLPGATVRIYRLGKATTAGERGQYELDVPAGTYYVAFSFIGYDRDSVQLNITHAHTYTMRLKAAATTMEAVTVSARPSDEQVTQTETGLVTLRKKDLESLPYLLGELDPIRIIQLMPGIQTSGEGSTGFYVRGGAVDQNLMQLDRTTVYNPSHLFGFFSIFNGSTIESIDLYKGGIPSYYGGRLSSITNITTRQGSPDKLKGEGSVGLIATGLLLEGPIGKKKKASFMIAARRTYVDLFASSLRRLGALKQDINYYFYDLNVNFDYSLGPRDHLRLRAYTGQDDFRYNTSSTFKNTIDWRNTTASLSWLHTYNDNLYSELMVNTSLYDMSFGAAITTYAFNIESDIRDWGFTYQVNQQHKKHTLAWGLTYTHHMLRPNNIYAYSEDVELSISPRIKLQGEEAALFINDKIRFSDKLEVNAGLRLSGYRQLGPFDRYVEDENMQVLDTLHYGRGKTIKQYGNLEPRLALRYSLSSSSSVKLSYDKTYQYLHQAPLSSVSLPLDIWVPSSSTIRPQSADQFSAGYFRNFRDNMFETSVVLYYKTMQQQLEYREGVIIGYSKGYNFDDNFVFGTGLSYGSEFSIKKNGGKLHGQISYTLSHTTRKFDALNKGKSFTAKYDRLHDLSVLANYVVSPRWTVSCVFVYGTGNALNLPVARYIVQENVVNEYGERNAFRMPPYHRMDLAATYTVHKSDKFESSWIFSVYNVYNRRNPYYIYFETTGNLDDYELSTSIKQVSLFPVIPAVTYRLKF